MAARAAGCEAYAAYTGHEGTKVTLFTSVLPPEQQRYEDAWKPFEDCTGIDIVYEGSDQFEAQLPTRIAGGNAPDLAWIPQPGLLAKLVQRAAPSPAPQSVADNVDKYFNPAWKAYGTVDGTFYGAPNSSNMKSFVWYSPSVFKDKGYTVPTTWDELFALSDQMVKDGIKPWCGGIESGGATGWPATDWLEQIVLRQSGGDVYDQWVAHTVKFDSPEITKAWTPSRLDEEPRLRQRAASATSRPSPPPPSRMRASRSSTASAACCSRPPSTRPSGTPSRRAPRSLRTATCSPSTCRRSMRPLRPTRSSVAASSPSRSRIVPRSRPCRRTCPPPSTRPLARRSPVAGCRRTTACRWTPTPTRSLQLSAKYLTDPTGVFRFDASDLMPAAVGAGAEWTQMTAWFAEDKPTQEVLQAIDAAWPAS